MLDFPDGPDLTQRPSLEGPRGVKGSGGRGQNNRQGPEPHCLYTTFSVSPPGEPHRCFQSTVTSLETDCRVTLTVTEDARSHAFQDSDGRELLKSHAGPLAKRAWPQSTSLSQKRNSWQGRCFSESFQKRMS